MKRERCRSVVVGVLPVVITVDVVVVEGVGGQSGVPRQRWWSQWGMPAHPLLRRRPCVAIGSSGPESGFGRCG